jgi:type II secretory pathway predicted ATPase ExeA
MYLEFFKLREFPFALSSDERFFFESAVHVEALANMIYTVQQRKGMVLVTGEVGAGKTFIGNIMASRLGPGCTSIMMQTPPQSGKQLLRTLALRMGLNLRSGMDKMELAEELQEQMVRVQTRGRLVALILDECQDLTTASLEELRLLWNWELNGQRLVQIVLVGQPELRDKLMEAKWEPLRQRIVLSYHLGPLSPEDTARYIAHRIAVASDDGCSVQFTPEAKADMYSATSGIPRLINILGDNALLVAYAKGVHVVDRLIVAEVLRDMTCWGLRVPAKPMERRPEAIDQASAFN